ncbi:MAG TPA: glycosyltransferase [Blastocatellia bacterium]|nr:glycosyltransferase [Blastocatellia bacterium]
MRILTILGQKPEMTGSGTLIRELWKCAEKAGDQQRAIVAAYPGDDYTQPFGDSYSAITYSHPATGLEGELPFPILGMSDVMPYPSLRYSRAQRSQIDAHIKAYQARMEAVLSEFKPDIIHIHHLWVLASLAKYRGNASVFVTVHGTDLKQAKTAPQYVELVKEGVKYVDGFLCVSRDILNDTRRIYDIPPGKAVMMGNGYNDDIFFPDGPAAECEGPVVVAAGKYVRWKGFHYLIRACGRLSTPHRLMIFGTGPEMVREALIKEAAANDMRDKMVLAGHVAQHELARWFRRADVFVLPSVYEPFGLVLLESMACGSPAIAGASGGANDIVRDDLIADGLATLVTPLKEGDPVDEERYVSDLHQALEKTLSRGVAPLTRRRISDSVKGLEWSNVYELVRAEYAKAARAKNG